MRFFFALWPPPHAVVRFAEVADQCSRMFGGKPTRPETIHLTLAFLGEVPDERKPLVIEVAQSIRAKPFELCIDRLGYWRQNHLLWAGCESISPGLQCVVDDLHRTLREAGIAFADDHPHFTPHLTLVRKMPELAEKGGLPVIEPIRWRCTRFLLVRSLPTFPTFEGPSYRPEAEFLFQP